MTGNFKAVLEAPSDKNMNLLLRCSRIVHRNRQDQQSRQDLDIDQTSQR